MADVVKGKGKTLGRARRIGDVQVIKVGTKKYNFVRIQMPGRRGKETALFLTNYDLKELTKLAEIHKDSWPKIGLIRDMLD